ncbi:hypothetical protein Pcinc_031074 [Petrolisthes cinctipes]|uniref:Uncharacterized protein n=1 Tax=Petrolisthes cinctipes TaxID=88211 RepID=A0AAE1K3I8_PETCI|nr:hypothetical protein Pcinc_031074 [Petrolisthes cinctipes]
MDKNGAVNKYTHTLNSQFQLWRKKGEWEWCGLLVWVAEGSWSGLKLYCAELSGLCRRTRGRGGGYGRREEVARFHAEEVGTRRGEGDTREREVGGEMPREGGGK